MVTRRGALALLGSGLTAIGGCVGGSSSDTETPTRTGTPTETSTRSTPTAEPTTSESTPTETDGDDETDTGDQSGEWTPAWTLSTELQNVEGMVPGDNWLYATLDDHGSRSAVAAVPYASESIEWRQTFEGDPQGPAPGQARDHRAGPGVAVAGGAVYAAHGLADEREWSAVYALDAASGERRWSFRRERTLEVVGVIDETVLVAGEEFYPPPGPNAEPDGPIETVLYGLDAASGDERWTVLFEDVEVADAADWGAVVATEETVTAVGLDGEVHWEKMLDGNLYALEPVGDATMIATGEDRDDTVVAGYGQDGERRWSEGVSYASLYARAGRGYAFGSPMLGIDPDGSVAWRADDRGEEPVFSPDGRRLYTRAGQGTVDAYALPAGRREFTFETGTDHAWPAAATNDVVVAEAITPDQADFTSLFAVDAEAGEQRAVARPDADVWDVVGVGDTVYVGFDDGRLAAYDADW